MQQPLNINLIIPFKDNTAGRLALYRRELDLFKAQLNDRVEELKDELASLFGEKFELTIAARSDGNAKKFFWRFTSSKRGRSYARLQDEPVCSYASQYDNARKLRLKEIEEELLDINANLKLLKGMLDSIEQSVADKLALRRATF